VAIVYVKETVGLDLEGGTVTLRRGDAWDAGAQIVKAHPHLFEDEPANVLGRVERATRAPGERRTTKAEKRG
jgi:hypothetical protein